MISLIAAIDRNGLLANGMNIPWQGQLEADSKYWRARVRGHTVVSGAKNFTSLGRPLPNSLNIVLSREDLEVPEGVVVVHSFEEAMDLLNSDEETFIIGGGQIFKLFLPVAEKLYLTHIDAEFEGDIFFPEWDEDEWELTWEEPHQPNEQNKFPYTFATYERRTGSAEFELANLATAETQPA